MNKQIELEKMVDDERQLYQKSKFYIRDMHNCYLQYLNISKNELNAHIGSHANLEFLELYSLFIEAYPENIQKNVVLLKNSLAQSIYGRLNVTLYSYYLDSLMDNVEESFVLIPSYGFFSNNMNEKELNMHSFSTIIWKKDGAFHIEIFDKLGFFPKSRTGQSNFLKKEYEQFYNLTNYYFKIKNTKFNKQEIIKYIDLVTVNYKFQLYVSGAEMKYDKKLTYFFQALAGIAYEEGILGHLGERQSKVGNCYIKEITGALNYLLGSSNTKKQLKEQCPVWKNTFNFMSQAYVKMAIGDILMKKMQAQGCSNEAVAFIKKSQHLYLESKNHTKLNNNVFIEKLHRREWSSQYNQLIKLPKCKNSSYQMVDNKLLNRKIIQDKKLVEKLLDSYDLKSRIYKELPKDVVLPRKRMLDVKESLLGTTRKKVRTVRTVSPVLTEDIIKHQSTTYHR